MICIESNRMKIIIFVLIYDVNYELEYSIVSANVRKEKTLGCRNT